MINQVNLLKNMFKLTDDELTRLLGKQSQDRNVLFAKFIELNLVQGFSWIGPDIWPVVIAAKKQKYTHLKEGLTDEHRCNEANKGSQNSVGS